MSSYRKCLLVDDDMDDHEIFNMAIADLNQDVSFTSAFTVADALKDMAAPGQEKPDYIFLDLNMPKVNARQNLEALKADPGLQDVPVIIYSTASSPREVNEYMSLGASAFVQKPSSIAELTQTLHHIFAA